MEEALEEAQEIQQKTKEVGLKLASSESEEDELQVKIKEVDLKCEYDKIKQIELLRKENTKLKAWVTCCHCTINHVGTCFFTVWPRGSMS